MTRHVLIPVCPNCDEPVGDAIVCHACGEQLTRHEKLPVRRQFVPATPATPRVRRSKQPSRCPMCSGTGLNKRGGPCGYCQATGQVQGLQAAGAWLSFTGGALAAVFWSLVALGVLVAVIVGLLT